VVQEERRRLKTCVANTDAEGAGLAGPAPFPSRLAPARRIFLRAAAAGLATWLAACAAPFDIGPADAAPNADAIAIVATPVPLDEQRPDRREVEHLIYRGGVELTSPDPRFGGWSDLRVGDDGATLTAISDRGFWLRAKVIYDAEGMLKGLGEARLGSLIDLSGRRLRGHAGDAEGLVAMPDGSFIVSFEQQHRFWHYPAAEPPFSLPPRALARPSELKDAPPNGGVEAIARLADGRLLALVEELYEGDAHVGWVGDGRRWDKLLYQSGVNFKPTGAAQLPDGELLVLERRFSLLGGFGVRIARVARGDIVAGARIVGTEIARLERPVSVDNFEGIAVVPGGAGRPRILIVSDDNYLAVQRTLLFLFELAD
jgi:hypothetical protein